VTSEEQGYNDFWHYSRPRQPDNEDYMKGYDAGWQAMMDELDETEEDYVVDEEGDNIDY